MDIHLGICIITYEILAVHGDGIQHITLVRLYQIRNLFAGRDSVGARITLDAAGQFLRTGRYCRRGSGGIPGACRRGGYAATVAGVGGDGMVDALTWHDIEACFSHIGTAAVVADQRGSVPREERHASLIGMTAALVEWVNIIIFEGKFGCVVKNIVRIAVDRHVL